MLLFLTVKAADDESCVVHGLSNGDSDQQEFEEWECYSSQFDLSSLCSVWSDAD